MVRASTIAPISDTPASHAAAVGSLADRLVETLAEAGIDTYFGVPGGAIEPLFNALARKEAEGAVKLIPMRSEAGAAFAADGYYRACGRIAVCTATTGPGIANLLTATMSAHADRIPLLVLTPQVALPKQGRGALQESSMDGYDLTRMLAECTLYSTTVTHPDQLVHKLERALATATGSRKGPVHLSIPSDILAGRAAARPPERAHYRRSSLHPLDTAGVDALVRALLEARAPVFYVGDDAGRDAHGLRRLARMLGGTVVSSPAGKRWIGHLDPTYRGVLGFSGHAEAREAMRNADLMIAFGATFDELSTNAWTALPEIPIFSVDRHDAYAYRLPNARPVIADAGQVIQWVLEQLPRRAPLLSQLPRAPQQPPALVQSSIDGPVHPSDLMRWLSYALPGDVVVHVDAGNSFSWSTRDLLRSTPDTYRVAMGLSTMCWAIAAVIGATVASPRRTLCLCGDGSMLMSSLELTVAVERQLPVTYVILNDSSLGMVRHGQRLAGAASIGHQIAPVRFDKIALACGARGARIECVADLQRVPHEWFASDSGGPAVIDVRIDREAVPPMADRVRGLGMGIPK
jgi:acetolactate synthase-1/2/3 large subunit